MINWFPGHMAKANRKILESLSKVDLVLEVVDARAVNATSNPAFNKLNKPVLKVALKADIADIQNIKWQPNLIIGSTKNAGFKKVLLSAINNALAPLKARKIAKGIKKPTFCLMVVGLPNVGKSSLINFLANKKITAVGNMPAITKKQTILKISDNLYLQDNPGIFFKNVEKAEEGYVLALVNTVKRTSLPLNEVNEWCYNYLLNHYFKELNSYFQLDFVYNYNDFIKFFATKRHFIMSNNQPDISRAEETLFDEFVNGKICKLNYEN